MLEIFLTICILPIKINIILILHFSGIIIIFKSISYLQFEFHSLNIIYFITVRTFMVIAIYFSKCIVISLLT